MKTDKIYSKEKNPFLSDPSDASVFSLLQRIHRIHRIRFFSMEESMEPEALPHLPKGLMEDSEWNTFTEQVIHCAYTVSNTLGSGFLEKVYENALAIELKKCGMTVRQQYPISVFYAGCNVGQFYADLLVDEKLIVELKSVGVLSHEHFAQCMNYLKGAGLYCCLLINFGKPRVEVKRFLNFERRDERDFRR